MIKMRDRWISIFGMFYLFVILVYIQRSICSIYTGNYQHDDICLNVTSVFGDDRIDAIDNRFELQQKKNLWRRRRRRSSLFGRSANVVFIFRSIKQTYGIRCWSIDNDVVNVVSFFVRTKEIVLSRLASHPPIKENKTKRNERQTPILSFFFFRLQQKQQGDVCVCVCCYTDHLSGYKCSLFDMTTNIGASSIKDREKRR